MARLFNIVLGPQDPDLEEISFKEQSELVISQCFRLSWVNHLLEIPD